MVDIFRVNPLAIMFSGKLWLWLGSDGLRTNRFFVVAVNYFTSLVEHPCCLS